ncbi:YdcF family protein [Novosphingobium album (ex Liu et al. 2023)]|uniref:YdcF family protein n=1 Tax=Novosphingobium album (ex Liu et al. 2023) TaxID=3031130 RepID=A0ABT5WR31_9SPHN|nr:YdcF family protein [Novosphingobium album (ex Liu et al. 2023)]MDE8652502.1 YdcF family protein [Novosphingobium album (ex Liu et al. 2023)]
MYRRIAATLFLIWILGFLAFAIVLPGPADGTRSDAIVVLTGSGGRIDHALGLLRKGLAPRLLVSGVDREVRAREFAAEYNVPARLMACCVTLGYDAYDTRSNAVEAARWIGARKARTVRLVTSDWHMRRASLELGRELPPGVTLLRDAVPSRPTLRSLFLEYHKFLASYLVGLWKR